MKIYERRTSSLFLDNLYKESKCGFPETFVEYKEEKITNFNNLLPIAFYLPQYYPIPINNKNWGYGFTEWTNVTRAQPQFIDHYQPHRPERFGYYDTRIPDLLSEQSKLAHCYGIGAFCFYYYCFQGEAELEYPIKVYACNSKVYLPFCLCWANENWTKRWDGKEDEILVEQKYGSGLMKDIIRKISSYFEVSNYLKIENRPIVIIYNPSAVPSISILVNEWREYCYKKNIANPYIIGAKTFNADNKILNHGLDGIMEFPPHGINIPPINMSNKLINFSFKGRVHNIKDYIEYIKDNPPDKIFRGAFPSWDNTSRALESAKIFIETTPTNFELWCDIIAKYTLSTFDDSKRFFFINAWNEWGEGAHLEPDRKYGYAYLQALRNILNKKF
jgi:lipopolysaccharide biosynthesis protein